jgi:shikimate dehydrogenase
MGVAAIARPRSADVLVNATTVGMDERTGADALRSLALDADLIRGYAHVVDLPYTTVPTPLVIAARELGSAVVDGLDVLVAQGALSFELWTGRRAPLDAMARAARDA